MDVPDDFPRRPAQASLAGTQPKLAVRLVEGKYADTYTPEELDARYDNCTDLVSQLCAYYIRKKAQAPERTSDALLGLITEALHRKDWALTCAEIDFCMGRVRAVVQKDA